MKVLIRPKNELQKIAINSKGSCLQAVLQSFMGKQDKLHSIYKNNPVEAKNNKEKKSSNLINEIIAKLVSISKLIFDL